MKNIFRIALLGILLFSQPLMALTLEQARQQGRAGETLTGYLAPVKQDKETLGLVDSINQARAMHYQQLADKNNLSLDEVAKLAGQKLVSRALPGEFVRGINGQWMKKPE